MEVLRCSAERKSSTEGKFVLESFRRSMMDKPSDVLTQGLGIAKAIWTHPASRGRQFRSVLRFLGWQVSKRTLRSARIIDFHGMKLKCYPDSISTSAALYFNGLSDYWEMRFLLEYLRPGDHFLDVGANAGVYSLLAATCVGNFGSIDAFEPMEDMARRIEEQARLNELKNINVHRLAVSHENGLVEFGFSASDAMRHIRRANESDPNGVRLQSIRLDDFQPEKQYAIGKMDIEGAEPLALTGSVLRMQRGNPPVWLLELAGYSTLYGISSEEVIALLEGAGYKCGIFEPECRRIVYTDRPWQLGVKNVLAISTAHRDFVEGRIIGARNA
jgi:FkbM family methyltransferase